MSPSSLALVLTAAAALAANGCGPEPGAERSPTGTSSATSTQVAYTRLMSAPTSGYREPAELVLRDRAAATAAWRTLYDGIPGNPMPSVDLDRRMIVLLALGERSTGGHAIRFDGMTTTGDGATVRYTVTTPGPSCATAQVITSPVDVVSVPRVDGEIRFERRTVVEEC